MTGASVRSRVDVFYHPFAYAAPQRDQREPSVGLRRVNEGRS
jgi:hypothetical protein